jgi:hypothetical protein
MAKEKGQKDKRRSTKHTYKTDDRVTRTSLITGVNYLMTVAYYNTGIRNGIEHNLNLYLNNLWVVTV